MGTSRREVFRRASVALGVAGAAAMIGAGGTATAADTRSRRGVTTFVFVSGASGGAGAPAELTLLGHRAVGVDLPGHRATDAQFRAAYQAPQDLARLAVEPSPMAGVTLDDNVAATVDVVSRVARYGPVILVGGSMGGATITRVGNEVPHLLDRIVYLSAFCCTELTSCAEYLLTPEAAGSLLLTLPGAVGDPAVIGASRTNWRSADPDFLAEAKAAMMADGTDAEFFALLNSLHPDESVEVAGADARIDPARWGRVPHTFVRFTRDRCIPLALQDRMIAEADRRTPGNRFDVRSVATSHAPDSVGWQAVLGILDGLTRR